MSGNLAGKVALVCNASSSLGYAIARRLGSAGAEVFLSDSDPTGLKFAVEGLQGAEIKASGLVTDLSITEQRSALFDKIAKDAGKLNVAVLNQKPNQIRGQIIDNTNEDFDKIFSKYLTVPFLTCKSALSLLEKSGSSSIVLISSIAGYTPFVDIGLYSAAQTAVFGLCKALSQNLAKRSIRVNSVCLGMFDDDGSGAVWSGCSAADPSSAMTSEEAIAIRDGLSNLIPLGRTGRGKDCAGLIEFLASEQSKYITGENFLIAGGISARI